MDTEANGLNFIRNSILEIAFKGLDFETGAELFKYSSVIKQPDDVWEMSDPDALKVNGFTYEKLQSGKLSETVRLEIISLFKEHKIVRGSAIYICQNPSFDRAFFRQIIEGEEQEEMLWPYHWLDLASMFWSYSLTNSKIKPWKVGLSKNAIAEHLGLQKETMPHLAMNGVEHLIKCYEALIGFGNAGHLRHS